MSRNRNYFYRNLCIQCN